MECFGEEQGASGSRPKPRRAEAWLTGAEQSKPPVRLWLNPWGQGLYRRALPEQALREGPYHSSPMGETRYIGRIHENIEY